MAGPWQLTGDESAELPPLELLVVHDGEGDWGRDSEEDDDKSWRWPTLYSRRCTSEEVGEDCCCCCCWDMWWW